MLRRLLVTLLSCAVALSACRGQEVAVGLASGCDRAGLPCVRYLPAVDAAGAPLNRATVLLTFTAPVRVADRDAGVVAVTHAVNLRTGSPEQRPVPVRAIRLDPQDQRQTVIDLDGLMAAGSTLAIPAGVLTGAGNRPVSAVSVAVPGTATPLGVALAGVGWRPAEPALFGSDGISRPAGVRDEAAVRLELEGRLRQRPGSTDGGVAATLGRFDADDLRRKVPDARLRAGLLMLTGTSGEPAIDFILAGSNRRNVPFQPLQIQDLSAQGAFAAVFYQPFTGKLHLVVDSDMALETLDNIAVVLAHEALHSGLGGGSAIEETLAMAANTRIYEELILFDPAIVRTPTSFTRQANLLVLALRNSGRFGYPAAGILPRPGIEDALAGVAKEKARSFRDLLFRSDFYGEIPRSGASGSEVVEAYFARISGDGASQGRLKFDQDTLKLFDGVMDRGLSAEQILTVHRALHLEAVALAVSQN